jgi:hypothetical protein
MWNNVGRKVKKRGVNFELATMYKTKDKKVLLVYNSSVIPYAVEGRLD